MDGAYLASPRQTSGYNHWRTSLSKEEAMINADEKSILRDLAKRVLKSHKTRSCPSASNCGKNTTACNRGGP